MDIANASPEQVRSDQPVLETEVLGLPIEDVDLLSVIDQKIKATETHYRNELKLFERRKENEDFWLGNHFDEKKLDLSWQVPYKDNIIWQDTETRISLASGRMPDLIFAGPDDEPETVESVKRTEEAVKAKIDTDVVKRIVKDGLRHNHLYRQAAIKIRWDRNRANGLGDFVFELVHPDKLGVDHTATIPHDGFTADNMELIYEWIEEPIGIILAKFPKKRDQLLRYFSSSGNINRLMVSKVRYRECHFTWYDQQGKIYEGTCWVYRDLVLDKIRTPYFDWEGYDTKAVDQFGRSIVEKKYRNHFERPRKPYIFFSYQNLGKGPLDDTTAVEQGIPIQKTINKRGRQITEISDRAVPKVVTSGQYITKEQARRISSDPNEILWLESGDDMRQAVTYIPGQPPNAILYQDQIGNRSQIDAKFATSSTTRGQTQTQESGISKQITREGDLTIADDIVDVVVERVVGELANWAVQMMKVMYREPRAIRRTSTEGELTHNDPEFSRDVIPDDMAIKVKASSTDKQTRRAMATDLAGVQAIDPYTMFEDLDVPNPKERTKRLILFKTGEQNGYAAYLESLGIEVGPTVQQPAAGGKSGGEVDPAAEQQRAMTDIAMLQGGEVPQPGVPTVPYLEVFAQFVQSPDFEALDPQIQQLIQQYIQQLKQAFESANVNAGATNAPAVPA